MAYSRWCRGLIASLSCCILTACIPVFSYPRFWDFTRTKPQDSDLVGNYEILTLRLTDKQRRLVGSDPRITLRRDHSAELIGIPEFDGFGEGLECVMSGTATWKLDGDGWGWNVWFENYHATNKGAADECKWENSTCEGSLILGRPAHYRLYEYVGDPDSDTGIEFQRLAN